MLLVQPVDVFVELHVFDALLSAAADLDAFDVAVLDEGSHLGHRDVQGFGDFGERVEPAHGREPTATVRLGVGSEHVWTLRHRPGHR